MFTKPQILPALFLAVLLMPLLFDGAVIAQDRIYRSVDKDGNPVFSDQGDENSNALELPPTNTLPAVTLPAPSVTAEEQSADTAQVAITSPANDENIINTGGVITVVAVVQPALQQGDMLQLLVDGNVYGAAQADSNFEITGASPGSHTLQVQLMDAGGGLLHTSDMVTVYVRQVGANARKAIPAIIGATPR